MRKLLFLLLILLVFFGSFPFWLPHLGSFLILPDDYEEADVIVVLRGDAFYRFHQAAVLHEKNMASTVLLSTMPERELELWDYYNFKNRVLGIEDMTRAEFTRKALRYIGLSQDVVEFTDQPATSTFEEALAVKKWMEERGAQSMILVTSNYHMRRAWILFNHVFKGTGVKLYRVTAIDPLYDAEHWWRRERDIKRVLEEYLFLGFNVVYKILLKKGHSDFDTI